MQVYPIDESERPSMLKACSEMGKTLYELDRDSGDVRPARANFLSRTAFIIPVTLQFRSPWHALHSIIPAFAMMRDPVYELDNEDNVDVFIFDQNMGRDVHIWTTCNGTWGIMQELLRALSPRWRILPLHGRHEPLCYERMVWGHELMMYSGSSNAWVRPHHVQAFTAHVRTMWVPTVDRRTVVVVERWPPAWGRRITNLEEVVSVIKHTGVEYDVPFWGVVDFATLSVPEQVRVAVQARILVAAHGDGLSWGIFMESPAAMLEAVPRRYKGLEVCLEGIDINPGGIFGGLCRLAGISHMCWANDVEKALIGEEDPWEWNWRKLDLRMDLGKLYYFLVKAVELTEAGA
eukprot:GEMP01029095.1.p1 GENE.GEMP01029095.1~~GEMP01029095.1.p1  ORF type:complete len:348 (+),score=97.76 GEMP01029095.1:970-2013(+)